MNMQQMIMQANKMQRELQKAMDALHEKDFTVCFWFGYFEHFQLTGSEPFIIQIL